jgi:hypothetical protein
MRIVKEDALSKYMNVKTAIYFDTRCIISPTENGLVCVFREPNGVASKRQREWMHFIFNRIAKRELGEFEISESKTGHFYLLATNEKTRKTGKNKSEGEQKPEGDI